MQFIYSTRYACFALKFGVDNASLWNVFGIKIKIGNLLLPQQEICDVSMYSIGIGWYRNMENNKINIGILDIGKKLNCIKI